MSTPEPLFPPSLISEEAVTAFPVGYTMRPLDRGDYARGFLDCLRVLSHVGDVTEAQFQERFDWMKTRGEGIHYHVVIEHDGRIVGTGAVIIERKFIHHLGTIGHVEEIAIAKEYQAKGLGLRLLGSLSSVARNVGCYKSTLGCSVRNEPFYMNCGYEKGGTTMSQYYEEIKESYTRG